MKNNNNNNNNNNCNNCNNCNKLMLSVSKLIKMFSINHFKQTI